MNRLLAPLLFGIAGAASAAPPYPAPSWPGVGRVLEVDFGNIVFEARFNRDGRTMTFTERASYPETPAVTVEYTAIEVAPDVYMLSWTREQPRASVVNIQNWSNGRTFSGMTTAELHLVRLQGSFRVIDALP